MLAGPLGRVAELVQAHGTDAEVSQAVATYVADRAATLSLASAYASTRSALTRDRYLTGTLGLTPRQVRAWLALIRGTRTTRGPAGRRYGGRRGLIVALTVGDLTAAERHRFDRLAQIAATGRPPFPAAGVCRHDMTASVRRDRDEACRPHC
jgi:hypothetical protein